VLQDAGGNAVFTSNGSGVLSGVNSGFGSAMVLLSTQTASNSASISFTSGIDSTYGEYIFGFYNINPATDDTDFQVNFSTDGTSWGMTKTTTLFRAQHIESEGGGTNYALSYEWAFDLAQSTSPQILVWDQGNGSDESLAGVMHLFSPSSTTYVKHFYSRINAYNSGNWTFDIYCAGYINDAANDVTGVQFEMASGNFDGTIKLWGVK
jgi:hypothetical protein